MAITFDGNAAAGPSGRERSQPAGALVAQAERAGLTNARGVAEVIEGRGGDWSDVVGLAAQWERVAERSQELAASIRRDAIERRHRLARIAAERGAA